MWQQRWALVGDSIQAWVLENSNSGIIPRADKLTASMIPFKVNASIQNVSVPGMRLAKGTDPSDPFDITSLSKLHGFFGLNGVVCTLGTNDYGSPYVTTVDYFYALTDFLNAAISLTIPVVIVSPIWRQDKDTSVLKYDGTTNVLADFQNTAQWVTSLVSANNSNVYFIDGKQAPVQNATYFGDGLHLNAAGHAKFCTWLVNEMKSKNLWQQY
ncbi:hypothetical protein RVBP17_3110 [Pseudomonas phage sp. 30-3]|nr:hypothetical protein RVBP17_3110 [Pseudomonas phage sp. 30-3]